MNSVRSLCVLWLVLLVFCAARGMAAGTPSPLATDEEKKEWIRSRVELQKQYHIRRVSNRVGDNVYFAGHPRDLSPTFDSDKAAIYRFDETTQAVTPVLTQEQYGAIWNEQEFLYELFFSAPRNRLVGVRFHSAGMLFTTDILSVDPETGEAEVLVADKMGNYQFSLSPDGQKLAYFASDPQLRTGPTGKGVLLNAGRVLNLATRKVTTYTESFFLNEELWAKPPEWLDKDRVLFSTQATDPELLTKHGKSARWQMVPYVAVVNVATGKVKKFFMPGGSTSISVKIYEGELNLNNGKWVVRSDWNLENRQDIAKAIEDGQ